MASDLVVDELKDGLAGLPVPEPQHGVATVANKITVGEDLHLDWREPAVHLHRVVRLEHAWTTFRGKRLSVLGRSGGGRAGRVCTLTTNAPQCSSGSLHGAFVATGQEFLEQRRRAAREPFPHVS